MQWRVACFVLLIMPAMAVLLGGCAHIKIVGVDGKPAGASIYVNGIKRGVAPTKVKLDFTRDPTQRTYLLINKQYYRPVYQTWDKDEVPTNYRYELPEE